MDTTIPTFLCASLLATGLTAQEARRPADVSLAGVDDLPLVTRPALGGGLPLACLPSLRDQATASCLLASSIPTNGMLFPYPGVDNVFGGTAFVGGGEDNDATGAFATIAGGYGNTANKNGSTVGGGHSNLASGGFYANQGYATVGGGCTNEASDWFATIGGGHDNTASHYAATVGGGDDNTASGFVSTVAGGRENTAGGGNSTIAGGRLNTANSQYAAVGGGSSNMALNEYATIVGGRANYATGRFSTVGGGFDNTAGGNYSFAAGRHAMATHRGSFVWGDGLATSNKVSSALHQFNVYCSGGARFFSDSGATSGVLLAPGSGVWTTISNRESKENIEPVEPREVLERLVEVPIATWNYRSQPDEIRHMGPMAQDFHAAFGLGLGDKTIDTIDPDGVALAAIQGLHAEVEELRSKQAAMEAQIAELTALLEERAGSR